MYTHVAAIFHEFPAPFTLRQSVMLILYGSEKGNARDCAESLARKCLRLRLPVHLSSLDDYNYVELLPKLTNDNDLVVIVCSTTGQGEIPRNGQKFWKYMLRKRHTSSLLQNVKFSTFGLGDSSYPRYNWAIRKIHRRLTQLGAEEFCARGEGDEMSASGIDTSFEIWSDVVWQHLRTQMLPPNIEPISESVLLDPWLKIELNRDATKVSFSSNDVNAQSLSRFERQTADHCLQLGVVTGNMRITSEDHFQDVRKFSFTGVPGSSSIEYSPGDAVEFYPCNNLQDVDALITHQNWGDIADIPVEVGDTFRQAVQQPLVSPLTLRTLLIHHLDINAIPRRGFFAIAHHFATDEREQERLEEFSNVDNIQDLYDYANRPRRSIVETITEFQSLQIPIDYILDAIPILQPRQFSIASGANSPQIELAVAIVKYRTIIRRIRRGVCTHWLENLQPGTQIPFSIVRTKTVFDNNVPIIMVAPGTGVAPMRSVILSRLSENNLHPMLLFFGCRYSDKDYIFREDWTDQPNLEVVCAFSREGGGYVQNKMYDYQEKIADMILKQNATVYVCGSAGKMPRQVRITLATILEESGSSTSAENAEEYLRTMEKSGRYLQETW